MFTIFIFYVYGGVLINLNIHIITNNENVNIPPTITPIKLNFNLHCSVPSLTGHYIIKSININIKRYIFIKHKY